MKVGDVIKTRDGNIFGTIVGKETFFFNGNRNGVYLFQVMTSIGADWYLKEHLETINEIS